MASYDIDLTDGSRVIIIPENVVDKDTTSIALVGHGQPAYGKPQNENFIHMLENFASPDEPNMPIRGQIWFKQNSDGQTYELKICRKAATSINPDGTSNAVWDKILKTSSSDEGEPQNPSEGDMWYDETDHQLKVYDGEDNGWVTIGPINLIHNENIVGASESSQSLPGGSYVIPKETFETNIQNLDGEGENTGSLHLVTLKVLIKEVGIENSGYDPTALRSAVMIYRFVVRSIAMDSTFNVSIIGAPNYEILAKSDNLDFTTNLSITGGDVVFTINNLSTSNKTYFVNGINAEIVKA